MHDTSAPLLALDLAHALNPCSSSFGLLSISFGLCGGEVNAQWARWTGDLGECMTCRQRQYPNALQTANRDWLLAEKARLLDEKFCRAPRRVAPGPPGHSWLPAKGSWGYDWIYVP